MAAILGNQAVGCAIGNPGGLRDRDQRLILFEVRLKQTEAIHSQPACVFRESGQVVHTRTVCQIKLTILCQIILKVTRWLSRQNQSGVKVCTLFGVPPERAGSAIA
jgi:hypothetical protein